DDSVVKPQEGELPVIGKPSLEKYWSDKPDTKDISWEPLKVEVARSGDLGYTLGNWKLVSKDTTMYGNYYTIWKKQPDGKWKFTVEVVSVYLHLMQSLILLHGAIGAKIQLESLADELSNEFNIHLINFR